MSSLRALFRVLAISALALIAVPLQLFVMAPLKKDMILPKLGSKIISKIAGITVEFNGVTDKKYPAIYVSNHMSYFDPFILMHKFTGSFLSKDSIAKWPVIGTIGRSTKVIFVKRTSDAIPGVHKHMIEALNADRNVILFPESTTSDGRSVLPFKAGLFSILFNKVARGEDNNPDALRLERDVHVHPVAIEITHVSGKKVADDKSLLDTYAWYGDMDDDSDLLSHAWNLLKNKNMTIKMTALPTLDPKNFNDHKDLINEAHRQVLAIIDP